MQRLFSFFVFLIVTCSPSISFLDAAQSSLPICSSSLKQHLAALLKIPEAKKLINTIQKEGAFQIIAQSNNSVKKFGACWDPDRRIIYVDVANRTKGFVIGSILFELHNASVNSQFKHLNRLASYGKIDKNKYIKSMEYIEYLNVLNASKISEKGINMGVLPKDAYLPKYTSFEEHFRAQKMSGHSAYFARSYEICTQHH
jgi:hypothetical protein